MKKIGSLLFGLSIAVGLAAVVFVIVRWVPVGRYPGDPFFDLAAQTIPILLVALAVEAQARRFDLEPAGKRIRMIAVILLACGETAAITVSAALFTPERGTFLSDVFVVVTAVGLLGGFFAVILVALRTSVAPALAGEHAAQELAPKPQTAAAHGPSALSRSTKSRKGALVGFASALFGTFLLSLLQRNGSIR